MRKYAYMASVVLAATLKFAGESLGGKGQVRALQKRVSAAPAIDSRGGTPDSPKSQ